ncbi:MAG: sigma-54 dependent transcriptional regulator [Thermodesulfobacteriota bacterium]
MLRTVLIIDDDRHIAKTLQYHLEGLGLAAVTAPAGEAGLAAFAEQRPDLVLLDLRLPDMDGLTVLERILAADPGATVAVVTAHATVDTAVAAMKKGAFDYLQKPFGAADVTRLVEMATRVRSLETEVRTLRRELAGAAQGGEFLTRNAAVRELLATARQAAGSDASLLFTGESGTGKGLLARLAHSWSHRSQGPFVTVDCTALQETLLESDLFGHVKGAFTGAVRDKQGKLELAEAGAVFLDEVAETSPAIQAKLLRFLQSREFEPVGGTRVRRVDARVMAATNRDLEAMVREGGFRQDLYFRLNVVELRLPPLRDRLDDIPLLAEHGLGRFAATYGKDLAGIAPEALDLLRRYPWPGNIRELMNVLERGVVLAKGNALTPADLPAALRDYDLRSAPDAPLPTLEDLEREHVRLVLARSSSLEEAARTLGIDPATLYRKRKRFGLA